MNWKHGVPLFAVFALALILFSGSSFAVEDETFATQYSESGNTRYISHAWTTVVNTDETKYTINQHHQWYGTDNLWHTNPDHDITETMRFVDDGNHVDRYNKLVVDDEQAVNSDGYQIVTSNTAYEVEQTWLLDSNQWTKHQNIYTTPTAKYNGNGLISPTYYEGYYMTPELAPTGNVMDGSIGHFLIESRAADGSANKAAYFNNRVIFYHPANQYEEAFMEAYNVVWTFETWIREPAPQQSNVLGQMWYTDNGDGTFTNHCIYIEMRDAWIVYHELGHAYNHYWTEAQCDAYATQRAGYYLWA